MYTVYALIEPKNEEDGAGTERGEIRYIGCTSGSLVDRLTWHMYSPGNLHLTEWFARLREARTAPLMIPLYSEVKNLAEALKLKAKAVKEHSSIRLLNIKDNRRKPLTRVLSVRVPLALQLKLEEAAIERDTSLGDFVNLVLQNYFPGCLPPLEEQ